MFDIEHDSYFYERVAILNTLVENEKVRADIISHVIRKQKVRTLTFIVKNISDLIISLSPMTKRIYIFFYSYRVSNNFIKINYCFIEFRHTLKQ